jgi:hypothetical protein
LKQYLAHHAPICDFIQISAITTTGALMIGQQYQSESLGVLRWLAVAAAIAVAIFLIYEGHPF